jgi:predicted PurR-regulated permease PerM
VSVLLPSGETPRAGADDAAPERRPSKRDVVRPRSVLIILGITLATLFVLSLGYLAWRAITWILIAAFLAMALNPLVELIQRRGFSRAMASTIVFLGAFIILGAIGFLLIPPLAREVIDFVEAAPGLVRELDQGRGPFGFIERKLHLVDRIQKAIDEGGAGSVLGFATPVADAARAVVATIYSGIAIAFLTFFMLLDGRRWINALLDVVPDPARPRWERVFAGTYRTVGGYVAGNLLISIAAAIVAGLTLFAVGVPYVIPLAVLVGILDLIPLVGAALATLLVCLVALTESFTAAAIVAVVLVLYQQFENHVLQPLVYGRSVQLSPLAVLVAVLVGAELAGVLGALAAIPVAGTVSVIAAELVRWRRESVVATPAGVNLAEDVDEPPRDRESSS